MTYEQRDNSGVLFKNERKEKDNHPDYNGNAMIDGREYWMSAWLKDGRKGKFMSFAFKPKDFAQHKTGPYQRDPMRDDPISTGRQMPAKRSILPADNYDDGDDIPF